MCIVNHISKYEPNTPLPPLEKITLKRKKKNHMWREDVNPYPSPIHCKNVLVGVDWRKHAIETWHIYIYIYNTNQRQVMQREIWARWPYPTQESFWCRVGFTAYLVIGGLLASYLPTQLFLSSREKISQWESKRQLLHLEMGTSPLSPGVISNQNMVYYIFYRYLMWFAKFWNTIIVCYLFYVLSCTTYLS